MMSRMLFDVRLVRERGRVFMGSPGLHGVTPGETFEIDRARVKLPHGFQIRQDGRMTKLPAPLKF
jgi:hypothetical protein